MAKFIDCFKGEREHFYLNMDMIEQVNPSINTVYMMSGEEYVLNEDDIKDVLLFVKKNAAVFPMG